MERPAGYLDVLSHVAEQVLVIETATAQTDITLNSLPEPRRNLIVGAAISIRNGRMTLLEPTDENVKRNSDAESDLGILLVNLYDHCANLTDTQVATMLVLNEDGYEGSFEALSITAELLS